MTSIATAEAAMSSFTPAVDGRLRLIDAFRALAALMVFGFHISPSFGGLSAEMLGRGFLGVQVFFAISGFVIAHSVGRSRITPRYVGNFILRRSVRNQFFLGALAAWVVERHVPRRWFLGYAGIVAVTATFLAWNAEDLAALVAGVIILVAGERGWLRGGLNWPGLQGLGRMSYSFYLVHTVVLARLTRLVMRAGIAAALGPFLIIPLGFGASVVAAWLLYRLAERPCVRLSKRFKSAVA